MLDIYLEGDSKIRIVNAFLILAVTAILFMLPMDAAITACVSEPREDDFTVVTAGSTNTTVQLFTALYENDTSLIDLSSNDVDDVPLFNSYNSTTRALVVTGLADNTTRTLTVGYDYATLTDYGAITTLFDKYPYIWYILLSVFPITAFVMVILAYMGKLG